MPRHQPTSSTPPVKELAALYVLDSIKGFGPQKFKTLFLSKIAPAKLLHNPSLLPITGKQAEPIRRQLNEAGDSLYKTCFARAEKQIDVASHLGGSIITYSHALYPRHVFESNNPVPILYARGELEILRSVKTIACVGSRKIRPPYSDLHYGFATKACEEGFTIVSGFAMGADTIAHRAATDHHGSTICVMPCGLDRPFPPENKQLWNDFLKKGGAVFASEFAFGTRAASLNLRKRNKSIVAFSLGVLIGQSSSSGGAMNAFRFALEQKKPVATFADDDTEETTGNAQIASDHRPFERVVFSSESVDLKAYNAWLRQLSSSI